MPDVTDPMNDTIADVVVGDDYPRTMNVTLPNGVSVTDAWFTVKTDLDDEDASAIFQKHITTTLVPGQGQITDDGALTHIAVCRFDLTPDDTILITPKTPGQSSAPPKYYFDAQIKTSPGGQIKTRNRGTISSLWQVTKSTS